MSQIETLHPQKEIGVVPLLQYFTTEAIQKQQHCIEQHAGNSLPGNLFYTRHGDFQKYCKKKKHLNGMADPGVCLYVKTPIIHSRVYVKIN